MKTRDLQQLWWDWLGTSERLLRSLYEQTAALTLRDVARVERIQPELDQMLAKLRELDAQAVTLAHKLAGELETEPNLRSLASVLEKAEAQALMGLGNRVTVAARNVQDVLKKNRTLIENEMNYINGSMTLVAKAAVQAQGPFNSSKPDSILVDQAA
jgi:predicted membrane chloride channel (bestrophin family)